MDFFYILPLNLTTIIMAKKTSTAAKKTASAKTSSAPAKVAVKKEAKKGATKTTAKPAVKKSNPKPAAITIAKPASKSAAKTVANPAKAIQVKPAPAKKAPVKKAPLKEATAKVNKPAKSSPAKTATPEPAAKTTKPATSKTAPAKNIPAKGQNPNRPKKIKQVFIPFNPLQPSSAAIKANKKEPKGKFELEYVIRCSEPLLYEFVSTPSGLSEWFSDDVNIRDGVYTFIWEGSEQKALLLAFKEEYYIRFQWADKTDGSYFEFRIQTDELTGDVSLIIVDFADNLEEQKSAKLLWDAQVDKLMKTIGSHA